LKGFKNSKRKLLVWYGSLTLKTRKLFFKNGIKLPGVVVHTCYSIEETETGGWQV
jgi:hypothetical protein